MSRAIAKPQPSEPEYAINWPAVGGAALLAAFLVLAPVAVAVCFPSLFSSSGDKVALRPGTMLISVESWARETTPLDEGELPTVAPASPPRPYQFISPAVKRHALPTEVATPASAEEPAQSTTNKEPAADDEHDETAKIAKIESWPDDEYGATPAVLDNRLEIKLRESLQNFTKSVDLEAQNGTSVILLAKNATSSQNLPQLISKREDLAGLPFRQGKDCVADEKSAQAMESLGAELARLNRFSRVQGADHYAEYHRATAIEEFLGKEGPNNEHNVAALEQILQADSTMFRAILVESLSKIRSPSATQALARRALYDLDREVRLRATAKLEKRPAQEYRQLLLEGLRYPWAAVAHHAAESLAQLGDEEAVPQLIELLDAPDPSAPRRDEEGRWVVDELVAVNHLRNCLLCHAPSTTSSDSPRGLIPTPGKPLPRAYYQSRHGDFVRADITYLKQDFSAMQPVADAKVWPKLQRFDYLIRTRELTPDEEVDLVLLGEAATTGVEPLEMHYPQRNAVLFALRNITGQLVSDKSEEWRKWWRQRSLASIEP